MLASRDLDDTTKSDWQSVMYNEISNGGKLGNFSVSDVYAVASDGKTHNNMTQPCRSLNNRYGVTLFPIQLQNTSFPTISFGNLGDSWSASRSGEY